ncbi:Erv1/Alr family protein [Pseudomassariella vexata]|uniref:Sulfhydryl oxidase n=1 Tax=Pseudomassariella vexata TaxID=1141098 RepID=A0A1Y2E5N1_9PEZI|nr:Erv1/Alr family protein [Pseudomassariella vexata]ORY66586.1 Erv1/Alr family protein [Pseudomassariella vexata]
MARHLSVIVILAITAFLSLSFLMNFGSRTDQVPQQWTAPVDTSSQQGKSSAPDLMAGLEITSELLTGDVIAPKLENATAKAELGRASWKLLHTMMARFPEKPTADESQALKSYIQLFSRLYPCGDCAKHFQSMLKQYPPQVGSRNSAAGWACFVHNQVNERLHKELFDCNKIGDFYDCGCGEEDKTKGAKKEYKGQAETEEESGELKKDG